MNIHIFRTATIALALLLIALQIYHAFNVPIWRDDAFFASVAKNLANGEGYAAVFFDKNYAFSHGISSGPVIILPATLMIFLFGNNFWAPSLANIILIWSLLIGIFIISADMMDKNKRWQFCFLTLLLTLTFSMSNCKNCFGDFGVETGDSIALWHLLMGEVPAALFVILGAFLLFSPNLNRKKIIAGGLFLGLAIMSKTITAMAVMVIFTMFTRRVLFDKKLPQIKQKIIRVLIVAIVVSAPFFLFELIKIVLLGWAPYLEMQVQNIEYYKHTALLIDVRENNNILLKYDANEFFARVKLLVSYFEFSVVLLVVLTIYVWRISRACLKTHNPIAKQIKAMIMRLKKVLESLSYLVASLLNFLSFRKNLSMMLRCL